MHVPIAPPTHTHHIICNVSLCNTIHNFTHSPEAASVCVLPLHHMFPGMHSRRFVAQLSRLCAPGGTVILVDFCRAAGPVSGQLAARLTELDAIFATPGNWTSADEYIKLMSEAVAQGWGCTGRGRLGGVR